jgi:hypothetical protein
MSRRPAGGGRWHDSDEVQEEACADSISTTTSTRTPLPSSTASVPGSVTASAAGARTPTSTAGAPPRTRPSTVTTWTAGATGHRGVQPVQRGGRAQPPPDAATRPPDRSPPRHQRRQLSLRVRTQLVRREVAAGRRRAPVGGWLKVRTSGAAAPGRGAACGEHGGNKRSPASLYTSLCTCTYTEVPGHGHEDD